MFFLVKDQSRKYLQNICFYWHRTKWK